MWSRVTQWHYSLATTHFPDRTIECDFGLYHSHANKALTQDSHMPYILRPSNKKCPATAAGEGVHSCFPDCLHPDARLMDDLHEFVVGVYTISAVVVYGVFFV